MKTAPSNDGAVHRIRWLNAGLLLTAERQATETGVEAGDASTAVQQLLLTAGPSRVRAGIDVEIQYIAFFPIGGTGLEVGAVRHHNFDEVIIGMIGCFASHYVTLVAATQQGPAAL